MQGNISVDSNGIYKTGDDAGLRLPSHRKARDQALHASGAIALRLIADVDVGFQCKGCCAVTKVLGIIAVFERN